MQINPYLSFNGQCEAAFKFYEKCLNGKVIFKMTNGESPMAEQAGPDQKDKIMHITMQVGDRVLQGADAPPQYYSKPEGFSVCLDIKEPAEAERVFNALAEKADIKMPIQETFWAQRFGMLVDQFSIPWMVNCSRPM